MFSNDESNNLSTNPSMQEVIDNCDHHRRFFLKCSLGTATLATFAGVGLGGLSTRVAAHGGNPAKPLIGFTSVAANTLPLTQCCSLKLVRPEPVEG